MRQDVDPYKWPDHPSAEGTDDPASMSDRIQELMDVGRHMDGLWRVTAVPGTAGVDDTANIIKLWGSATDALGDRLANVWVPPGLPAAVDDLGIIVTMPSGEVAFLSLAGVIIEASESQSRSLSKSVEGPSGAGAGPLLIFAQEDMPLDSVLYECWYRRYTGAPLAPGPIYCYRPPGIYISSGDYGFLGIDKQLNNVFIPANMREEANMPLVVEQRTSDPLGFTAGRLWYRTDLEL